jgi:hypothetical protein
MSNQKIECTVGGVLKNGRAMCGYILVGCQYCSLKLGECNLQKGMEHGVANGAQVSSPQPAVTQPDSNLPKG